MRNVERRARLLAYWYPRAWRTRYGDEFVAMLADDMRDQPRSMRRTGNVAVAGVRERCVPRVGSLQDSARVGLMLVCTGLVSAMAVGLSTWSRLNDGVQSADYYRVPVPSAIRLSAAAMTSAAAVGLVLVVAAFARTLVAALRAGARWRVLPPLALVAGGLVLLVLADNLRHERGFTNDWGPRPAPIGGSINVVRGLLMLGAWTSYTVRFRFGVWSSRQMWLAMVGAVLLVAGFALLARCVPGAAFSRLDGLMARLAAVATAVFVIAAAAWVACTWFRRPDYLTSGPGAAVHVVLLGVAAIATVVGSQRITRSVRRA